MFVICGVLLFVGIYWMIWMSKAYRMDKLTASLPVLPRSLPFIGHATLFIGNTQQILENIWVVANLALKHKKAAKVWLGPKLYVAIADPVDAQVVLENCLDKDGVYRFLQPWLGNGLFVAPVNLWKIHRKLLIPIFRNKIVEEYLGVIAEQANVLLRRLDEHTDKEEFDIMSYVSACTLDIVFETAMGERMNVQHSPDTPYLLARQTVMTILNMRFFKVWLQPDWIFNLTSYAKQQKDNIELTHKFTDEVVKKRREEYNNNLLKPNKEVKFSSALDLLFQQDVNFTDEQLREHIDSITIAGNDTTALVIAYTLVLLGTHQDAQERVIQEQRTIFGSSTRGADKGDLLKMEYLERVIKESMRLYTVVPIIARNVDKDTFLPSCEVTLPAGTGAVIGAFALHRSESAWGPEPNNFDPDRFLPERSADRHPAAFLPFSYGSRNCIGRNFGMLSIKSIISSVVRSYKLEAEDIGDLKIEILLFPIKGHQIRISKRIESRHADS